MRIANRRHEAVDEQRWFGAPCLIRDLELKSLSVPEIDVAVQIDDDPHPSDRTRVKDFAGG